MSSAATTSANTAATTSSNTTSVYTNVSSVTSPVVSPSPVAGKQTFQKDFPQTTTTLKQISQWIFNFNVRCAKICLGLAFLPLTFAYRAMALGMVAVLCVVKMIALNLLAYVLVMKITIKVLDAINNDKQHIKKWIESMYKILKFLANILQKKSTSDSPELSFVQVVMDEINFQTNSDLGSTDVVSVQEAVTDENSGPSQSKPPKATVSSD